MHARTHAQKKRDCSSKTFNPRKCGLCVLVQIWVNSPHNASGYFTIYGDESLHHDHFESFLATGDIQTPYARTGFLGFIRRTELTQSDGGEAC